MKRVLIGAMAALLVVGLVGSAAVAVYAQTSTPPTETPTPAATETPVVTDVPVVTVIPPATETPVVTETQAATETPAATESPAETQPPAGPFSMWDRFSNRWQRPDVTIAHDLMLTRLAEAANLSVAEINAKLNDGTTLYEIATEAGLTVEEIQALVNSVRNEALAKAVEDGQLSAEEADVLRYQMVDSRGGFMNAVLVEKLAAALDMTVAQLQARYFEDKSLAQIAYEGGVSLENFTGMTSSARDEVLAAAVEAGTLTQEQADAMKVDGLGMAGGRFDMMGGFGGHGMMPMQGMPWMMGKHGCMPMQGMPGMQGMQEWFGNMQGWFGRQGMRPGMHGMQGWFPWMQATPEETPAP